MDELLPILLEFLSDASSSQKRELSLWTLGQGCALFILYLKGQLREVVHSLIRTHVGRRFRIKIFIDLGQLIADILTTLSH